MTHFEVGLQNNLTNLSYHIYQIYLKPKIVKQFSSSRKMSFEKTLIFN